MSFTVLIPARLASTRLPDKPLALIGKLPMVVRVAMQAARSGASKVVVAADSQAIVDACQAHGVNAVLTRSDHPSGSDRLAEACDLLKISDTEVVVNVQGDEPLIDPQLINAVAELLLQRPDCAMSTAAHGIETYDDYLNPNVVKVVLDARSTALYFTRAPVPAARDFQGRLWWGDNAAAQPGTTSHQAQPLRHIGIYGYRVGFLRQFPALPPAPLEQIESLEQLRAVWHGHRIAVHVSAEAPGPGVDTPADLERVRALVAGTAL